MVYQLKEHCVSTALLLLEPASPRACSAEAEGSCPIGAVRTRGPQGSCLAAAGSPSSDIPEHGEELHLEGSPRAPGAVLSPEHQPSCTPCCQDSNSRGC